jgi:serine/threonine protein kinase
MERVLSDWLHATNGLQYRIWRLRHRELPEFLARGKSYDLDGMQDESADEVRAKILRHAEICRRMARHPQIPILHSTFGVPQGDKWWVVEEYVPGATLDARLRTGPLSKRLLPKVMRQIGEGLAALHTAGIVRRELAPRFIVLRESDQSVVLTDFEFGKLLDGSPTVSKHWDVDPYRAPEVGSDELHLQADVYSWGRILLHAASGKLPEQGREDDAWDETKLPAKVAELGRACVEISWRARPQSMTEILAAIRRWR